ncbi:DUF1446 domain-containing protein [Pelagibacteraceae bacterium]|nr:DUF1446 domain-containing protein [Pelagibacteraceae bacterium]
MSKQLRIGGASGFWGDSVVATPQLLNGNNLDFIVYDYLAEITMSIMARARAKDPLKGYAIDFVSSVMKLNLRQIADQKVKILSNAGGVNPQACAEAIRALIKELNLDLKVAVVLGDDLLEDKDKFLDRGVQEMYSGEKFPELDKIASINAYLGAFPIAQALNDGADIVITGRSVDSAVTLAACIHTYGWKEDEYDKLASGSLAGHIIECGTQSTGGNFTDWELVSKNLHMIGYPIVDVSDNGEFICTKSNNTSGLVSFGTVAEQMLYEIGDPQAYILPDVVCDFSNVIISEIEKDAVKVSGAKGYPAPQQYKVCATYSDGFRAGHVCSFVGIDAAKKARTYGEAIFERAKMIMRMMNIPDFDETSIEIIGDNSQYSNKGQNADNREVVLKFAAKHQDIRAVGLVLKESVGLGLATPPGLSGFVGGRPKPSPIIRLFSFMVNKEDVKVSIDLENSNKEFLVHQPKEFNMSEIEKPETPIFDAKDEKFIDVPLIKIAYGRSGDKGNKANIGIISRDPKFYPAICNYLTEDVVMKCFKNFLEGSVEKYLLPGSNSINFMLNDVLGGGGPASLRNDPQGKAYAQILLDQIIPIPKRLMD